MELVVIHNCFGDGDDVVSDEKTTLADATVTTTATPTVDDNPFTSDLGWQGDGDGDWDYNASNYLDFSPIRRQSTAQVMYIDLQDSDYLGSGNNLSDTKWVIRLGKWTTVSQTSSTANVDVFIGVSTNGSGGATTSQEAVIWSLNGNSGDAGMVGYACEGSMVSSRSNTTVFTADNDVGDKWLEIIRDGDVFTFNLYSDEYVTKTEGHSVTRSGIAGLRYFKIANDNESSNSQTWNAKLYGLEIYNGITAVSSTTATPPEVGTRYEEVDTRKIYRWATGGTIWEENATRTGGEQTVNQSGWQNYNAFKVPSSLAGKKVKSVVVTCHAQTTDQSPTGTISAHIYNGTTKKAESDTINTSTLATGSNIWASGTTCTFTGGTLGDYTLQTDDYVAVVANTVRTGGGYVQTASTDSQGSGTNRWYRTGGGSWTEDTNNTMYMTVTAEDDWKERGVA